MEFRVYAAFGYVTKVVSNGRVNAKLHATPRNWLRLCGAVLYRRFAIGRAVVIVKSTRQNQILRYSCDSAECNCATPRYIFEGSTHI